MKDCKTITVTLLFLMLSMAINAQTLQEGRRLFAAGNYEAALPIMQKYIKGQPNDPSLNYWYGVCLYETGQKEKCPQYLEKAAKRKIIKAYRHLSMYYADNYRYQEAADCLEKLADGMEADKTLHDEALEEQYRAKADKLRKTYRLLRTTEKVCFIDSIVVSKNNFLKHYLLDPSSGSIGKASEYFDNELEGEVYIPEMQVNIYFSRTDQDSIFHIYRGYRSFNEWSDIAQLEIPGTKGNIRYPFVLTDGITVYYASDGPESIGGYDIFVTRQNQNTGNYLIPENIGMPFNSEANDYMYAVDDVNSLGWFATDRNQPSDSVCIYTFIPNETRITYNYENGDTALIQRASRIASIAETQTDADAVRSARQRLALLRYGFTQDNDTELLTFVIDDFTDYHEASDFRSDEARTLFGQWNDAKKVLDENMSKLLQLRSLWPTASIDEQVNLRPEILTLEKAVEEVQHKVNEMEIAVRNTEIEYLTR